MSLTNDFLLVASTFLDVRPPWPDVASSTNSVKSASNPGLFLSAAMAVAIALAEDWIEFNPPWESADSL